MVTILERTRETLPEPSTAAATWRTTPALIPKLLLLLDYGIICNSLFTVFVKNQNLQFLHNSKQNKKRIHQLLQSFKPTKEILIHQLSKQRGIFENHLPAVIIHAPVVFAAFNKPLRNTRANFGCKL